MRRLTLHASALNDDEYDLYTASLKEIAEIEGEPTRSAGQGNDGDDEYYEGITLGVREVRAWVRGRYSTIPAATIDNILRFFAPNLAQADTLTGGQFFAALRLVMHVQSGEELDRTLAFVQVRSRPSSPKKLPPKPPPPRRTQTESFTPPPPPQRSESNPFVSRARPPPARSEDGSGPRGPPLPPRKSAPATQTSFLPPPRHGSQESTHGPPPQPPPKPASHVTSNLMKQSLQASKVAQSVKRAEENLEKERIMQVLKSSNVPVSKGPFRAPSKPQSASSVSSEDLPPRHRRASPSLSAISMEQVALAGADSPTRNHHIDLPVPPPTHPDRKPLNTFDAVYGLASTDTTTTSPSPTHRTFRSKSLHHPPIPDPPPRRKRPESVQVLTRHEHDEPTVDRDTTSPFAAPPKHGSVSRHASMSVSSRPGSRGSLHRRSSLSVGGRRSPSLGRAPPPRVPSKPAHSRSPSVSGSYSNPPSTSHTIASSSTSSPLNMKTVLSSLTSTKLNGKIASSFEGLQPKFEKARFKAEAGLSKRGFVPHSSHDGGKEDVEGLVRHGGERERLASKRREGDTSTNVFDDPTTSTSSRHLRYRASSPSSSSSSGGQLPGNDVDVDDDEEFWVTRSTPGRTVEKDNLKWPVGPGEGWKPL